MKGPTTHKVHVQMGNGLSSLVLAIDNQAVTVCQAKFPCQLYSYEIHVPNKRSVLGGQGVVGRNYFFWDDQHMDRGLWMDIMKREAMRIVVDDSGRDFSLDDLRENVVGKHGRVVHLLE